MVSGSLAGVDRSARLTPLLTGKGQIEVIMQGVVNGQDWVAILDWENGLQPEDRVIACWTNSFRYYRVPAVVVRNNVASVRIRLTEDRDGYRAGREFAIPKLSSLRNMFNDKWSLHNRVVPVDVAAVDTCTQA